MDGFDEDTVQLLSKYVYDEACYLYGLQTSVSLNGKCLHEHAEDLALLMTLTVTTPALTMITLNRTNSRL